MNNMLKVIHGECSLENAILFKSLEDKFPVTIDIEAGGSETHSIFTATENEEGVIGFEFFKDMKLLIDYAALLKQSQTFPEQQLVAKEEQLVSARIDTIPLDKVPYLLALWNKITISYHQQSLLLDDHSRRRII